MHHFKSNIRDIQFNLFEFLDRGAVLGSAPYGEVDEEAARDMIREVDRLARTELAASYEQSDREPPTFDPPTGEVHVHGPFRDSVAAWIDSGWPMLEAPSQLGGPEIPPSLLWSVAELVSGANSQIWNYGRGIGFANILWEIGNDRDRTIARHMVEQTWGATMVLTEPEAGSDVGAGTTTASRAEDGTWHLRGVKRFITGGEHDLLGNIIHLVLARPVDEHGHSTPGSKGLSLFVVPRHHFDLETGELTGARNGVRATALENKMGIKVSTTCELTFGDDVPAVGWLVGESHDGIRQMFEVISDSRMSIGVKCTGILSSGYLNALAYAKERVQGPDLLERGRSDAARVPIIRHPDVRRSLMVQKSLAEALRAMWAYTASWLDRVDVAKRTGVPDPLADGLNGLLMPVLKGYASERAWTTLGTETLQTFGGSGFLQDFPIEQYVRDTKIDSIYEGTTAIQGLDLYFRKISKDDQVALSWLIAQMRAFETSESTRFTFQAEALLLSDAIDDLESMVGLLADHESGSREAKDAEGRRQMYIVGLQATRLLMAMGTLVGGWLLLEHACVAHRAIEADASSADETFYRGKIASARFFAREFLPELRSSLSVVQNADASVMDDWEWA